MYSKKIALAVLASAFMSTTALAQSNPPAGNMSAPAAKSMQPAANQMDPVAVQSAQGKWRASKLIGVGVYNSANEKVGDINELITDSSGKIHVAVIGVGGFLGIGEHNVGIAFDQLKFANEPVRTTATGTGTTGAATTTTTTTATTATNTARDYPERAVINMTKEQLKDLPAFKYASDTSARTTTTTSPAPAARPVDRAPATAPAAR